MSDYDRVLEVGIGRRPGVATALADRGVDVRAIDVDRVPEIPDGVRFRRQDVTEVGRSLPVESFHRVDAVYALAAPPELHADLARLAGLVDADCLFTTLGYDEPCVPVDRDPVDGEAGGPVYVVDTAHPACPGPDS